MTNQKYYVVATQYVGPNSEWWVDYDKVEITTEPPRGNSRGLDGEYPIIINGWCGTTNDVAVYGLGEFDSIDEARAAVFIETPNGRRLVEEDNEYFVEDGVIETYKYGNEKPLTRDDTVVYIYEDAECFVTDQTTDAEITVWCEQMQESARVEGFKLNNTAVQNHLLRLREELQDH